MRKHLVFVTLLAGLASCYDDKKPQFNSELSEKLVGEWQNTALKISLMTYNNSDSSRLFQVKEGEWEQKMNIRPVITNYLRDGSYTTQHINLRDSVFYRPAGKWMIVGDTLHLKDTFPQQGPVYKYRIVIKADKLELFGLEDCDHDGKDDDEYYGKSVRR